MSIYDRFLEDTPLRAARTRFRLPQTRAAKKRVSIVPTLNSLRKRIQLFRVAAAEHDVVGDQRFFQLRDREFDLALPLLLAKPFQTRPAKIIFNDCAIPVWQIAEFEREDRIAPNKSRTEPGSEAEKQHPAAAVAAERLHRRVVNQADRLAQGLLKIKSDPAVAEMFWFAGDAPIHYRRRKSHRDKVEFPTGDQWFDLRHHFARR